MPNTLVSKVPSGTQVDCGTGRAPLPEPVRTALLAALEIGPQAVALFDASDRLAFGNESYREAWGVEPNDPPSFASIMRTCHAKRTGALIETDDIEAWIAAAQKRRRSGPGSRAFEVDLIDGRWFWMTEHLLADGWLLSIGQDITALKHNEQTLRAARDLAVTISLTDSLTQLANRRHALRQLEMRIAFGKCFYLALIDVDNFKRFNDDFGHAVGDAVLMSVARRLEDLKSTGCLVARLSGDEFAVIGPPERDQEWFEGLLCSFSTAVSAPIVLESHEIRVALSIGAAQWVGNEGDAGTLLASADVALYEAKRSGRSAIRFYKP